MTFIDLFAGIGGMRRGMELAGHRCVGFCEWDKFATASYTSMHLITEEQRAYLATLDLKKRQKEILKDEYRNGEWYSPDIRQVGAGNVPRCDCWCFGAPCQDFSVAGKRAGLDGDRSSLIREVFRVLGGLEEKDRPEWLIYENVKGMLSSNRGGTSFPSSWQWKNWGMISNGLLSTASITEYPKTASACILSDILEDAVPKEYFLSNQRMEQIAIK